MTIYVSLSGGMDSTALIATTTAKQPVVAVSFNYGQRHVKELAAARAVAAHFDAPHRVIDLPRLSSPALTGDAPIPHGHYAADTMTQTVVQGRNLLFAATMITLTRAGDSVALGVHAGDHAIYPDCRPDFMDPLHAAVAAAYGVEVMTPFIGLSKAEIVTVANSAGAPLHLSWSCYEGGDVHCGRCGTCVERAEAFHLAGVDDPTVYADADYWRSVT